MKRGLLVLAACTTRSPVAPEAWQLAQDRVVAVRATPPSLAAGEHGLVDALIAHADGPTTVEAASVLVAAHSPLFTTVHYLFDHYELIAPDEQTLADARVQLGLAAGEDIPLEVECDFEQFALITDKRVLLGRHADNPVLGPIAIGGQPAGATVVIAHDADVALEASGGTTTRWLASCGDLDRSDQPAAVLHAGAACSGELVVVERDATGGTVWQVWPLTVE